MRVALVHDWLTGMRGGEMVLERIAARHPGAPIYTLVHEPGAVSAAIEAHTLEEATQKFPEAIQAAVERLVEEARELQRREMSRIVVPGSMPPGPSRGKFEIG